MTIHQSTGLSRWAAACLVALPLSCFAQASPLWAEAARAHLYGIGGGYDTALQGYVQEVMRHAQGPRIDIVMLPAAFADDPVLPEDPGILADDVAALQGACEAVLARSQAARVRFSQGCNVRSAPLYVAADARDPNVLEALYSPSLDGVFFNGGDQGYAMRILANTPAEAALNRLAGRGVVVGGTSAGAAIQSLVMNAGYTEAGDATTALQKGAIDMWWRQTPNQRGLIFGSQRLVIDEHVYSRGRLGRMINASAQTAEALGQGGLLGLGLDYDTGIAIDGDRQLRSVSGVSSAVVVDLRTADARYRWQGEQQALSARRVLTHLLPPSQAIGFDLARRAPLLGGMRLNWLGQGLPPIRPQLAVSDAVATLMLSGDISGDLGGPVLHRFTALAKPAPLSEARPPRGLVRAGQLLIVASAFASADDARALVSTYNQALADAGWTGSAARVLIQGQDLLDPKQFASATGVIFVGGEQARLATALADPRLRASIWQALHSAQVVMFEGAMLAAVGERFDAVSGGDSQDDAIAAFRADNAQVQAGLGLVRGAVFEPRLQLERRWGRLYGMAAHCRACGVWGISESSAIVIAKGQAQVLGANPVVALDARRALFATGDNGALAAFNVLLDVYEPGDVLGRSW